MKRERMAWVVCFVVLSVMVFHLPGSLAQRDDDYAFVRTLVDIHRHITSSYVDSVNEDDLREKAIEGMMSDLDPFSVYVPPAKQKDFDRMLDNSFEGVGIQLDMQDGKVTVVTPIDGSPAFNAGVMAGDVILQVDGQSIEGIQLQDLVKKIGGKIGSTVKLTVQHTSGETAELTMARQEIVLSTVKGYQRKPDDSWDYYVSDNPKIAYLRITQFTEKTFDEIRQAMAGTPAAGGKPGVPGIMHTGMKGLILDLRFNPGGRLDAAEAIVNLFVKEGVIVSTKGRSRPENVFRATGEGTLPYFPMIVLVNEHSASAAEIVSGSLKDNHRALVVGTRTYGKGSVQEVIPMDNDGGELKLTVAYYYLPSGRLVHRKKGATDWGVEPQIIVPVDEAAERQVLEMHVVQETVRRPIPKPTTRVAAAAPTTDPVEAPVDVQLQQAINTMVGLVILQGSQAPADMLPAAATAPIALAEPATQPSTRPGQ